MKKVQCLVFAILFVIILRNVAQAAIEGEYVWDGISVSIHAIDDQPMYAPVGLGVDQYPLAIELVVPDAVWKHESLLRALIDQARLVDPDGHSYPSTTAMSKENMLTLLFAIDKTVERETLGLQFIEDTAPNILDQLAGTWIADNADYPLSFVVEPDGTGTYTIEIGTYTETYEFTISLDSDAFSVAIPKDNERGIVTCSGTYAYADDVLTLQMSTTFANGSVYTDTVSCQRAESKVEDTSAKSLSLAPKMLTEQEKSDITAQITELIELGMSEEDVAHAIDEVIDSTELFGDIPPDFAKEWIDENRNELRNILDKNIQLLSQSPDGTHWYGVAGSLPFIYDNETGEAKPINLIPISKAIAWLEMDHQASGHMIGISRLRTMYHTPPESMYDSTSFNWSPDGQYLCLTFWPTVMENMREQELYIIDVAKSTIHIGRAFKKEPIMSMKSILQACFSTDGQTIYHTVVGQLNEGRVTVWNLDRADGSYTYIASAENGDARGDLSQLITMPDGRLLQVIDSYKATDPRGLFVYAPGDTGNWKRTEHILPVTAFLPWKMTSGLNSEKGLLHFRTRMSGFDFAVSLFDAGNEFSGMNQLLILRGFEEQTAELLPLDSVMESEDQISPLALKAYPVSFFQTEDDETTHNIPEKPALYCLTAAVSSEGDKALLLMQNPVDHQIGFIMLDLNTLQVNHVDFPWDDDLQNEVEMALSRERLGLHWATNDQVSLSLCGFAVPLGWG